MVGGGAVTAAMVGRASEEDGRTPDIEGMAVSER